MGLISKTVEVEINPKNMKHLEECGYEMPRRKNKTGKMAVPRGTKITVDVNDLSHGSSAKVKYKCDNCGEVHEILWADHLKQIHDGKTYCANCAVKVLRSGENSNLWKPNKSRDQRIIDRAYPEYNEFVKRVLARDNYTCQVTGKSSKEATLIVHHLDSYDWCEDKRTDVTNGITLSEDIHKAFHAKYGRGNNTKEQFEEFLGGIELMLEDYNGTIPTARWAYCVTDNEIIENTNEYAKSRYNTRGSRVRKCCNNKAYTFQNKVYMWYDEYIKLSPEEVEQMVTHKLEMSNIHKRPVVCMNYKLLFKSITDAIAYFDVSTNSICACCRGRHKYSGIYNGEKLVWRYASDIDNLDEYTLIPNEECQKKHDTNNLTAS